MTDRVGKKRVGWVTFLYGLHGLTGGARVAAKHLYGDPFADPVVGVLTGPTTSLVRTYLGKNLTPTDTPPVFT